MTTFDDLLFPEYRERRRPRARHRAAGRARTGLYARATAALAAARQTARDALRAAVYGSGTPAGGLALHAGLQRPDGRAS